MDFNGNPSDVVPSEIDIEKVCSKSAYIEQLNVGGCDNPSYTLPTETPTNNEIIATRAGFLIEGNDVKRSLNLGYSLGAVFKPGEFIIIPEGKYTLTEQIGRAHV